MQPGLKTLLALALALGLAACARPGGEDGSAPRGTGATAAAPARIADDAIEVTALDAPTPAPATAAPAAETPAAQTPAAATPAPAPAPAAEPPAPPPAAQPAVAVQAATPDTPHPRPRPAAGGAASPDAAPAETPPPEPPKSQSQLLCEASGGVWGQSSDTGAYLCQKKTRDGGKQCRAKGDCQGECLAPSGTCAPVTPLLGCNDILDAQGRRMTLCLD